MRSIINTKLDFIGFELERFNNNFFTLVQNPDLIDKVDFQYLDVIINDLSYLADLMETITVKNYT